jgi:hypothetical protein
MGDGTVLADASGADHFWDGDAAYWWQGYPTTYAWTFTADGDGYVLEMDMSAYDGGFIYEGETEVAATGEVSGAVTAERCEGLSEFVTY